MTANQSHNLTLMVHAIPLPREIAEPLLTFGEIGLVVFGVAVAVGIIGEHVSEKRRDRWMPPHIKPKGWNWPLIWLWVVVAGVALECISDGAIWEASDSLQAISDQETAALEVRATAAEKQIASAKAQATIAQADAAGANERVKVLENQALVLQKQTADAEKAAADAQAAAAAANERSAAIQQAAAWRIIPEKSARILVARLAVGSGGRVTLSYPVNDSESFFLAMQFERIFRAANVEANRQLWSISPDPRMYARAIHWGVRVFGQNEVEVQSVRDAFAVAELPFLTEGVPLLNGAPGMMVAGAPSEIEVYVGQKKQPTWLTFGLSP